MFQLQNDTVVHVWRLEDKWAPTMEAVTAAGFHGVLSSCWYLNYISYGIDWHKYYACDPQSFEGDFPVLASMDMDTVAVFRA